MQICFVAELASADTLLDSECVGSKLCLISQMCFAIIS